MPLFRKKPDATALTLALVEDYGRGDDAAIAQGRQALAPLSTREILFGLFRFGQFFAPKLKPEHQDIVRQELAAVEGTPPFRAAVQQVGAALFISGQLEAVTTAADTYFPPLDSSTDDATRRVAFALIAALGQICVKCSIKLNWG